MIPFSQIPFLLVLAAIPALAALVFFFHLKKWRLALVLLGVTAFALRLIMAFLDPYLNAWDERFHALVARNMLDDPFRPLLFRQPILEYDWTNWAFNHIWLHKQPLFLWQMAASMKIFGIHEWAVRLPSVVLSTWTVFMVYEVAMFWTKCEKSAFFAGLLFAFSGFQLGLVAGMYICDHNDVAFCFYVTASIWALVRYLKRDYSIRWALLVGLLAGGALLTKWLAGMLVFGGWGLFLIMDDSKRYDWHRWRDLLLGVGTTLVVFLPWQIYTMLNFPMEWAHELSYNSRHLFEVIEGHSGTVWYHVDNSVKLYGPVLRWWIPIGMGMMLLQKKAFIKRAFPFLAMILVTYLIFTVAKTKLYGLTNLVGGLMWIVVAFGLIKMLEKIPVVQKATGVGQSMLVLAGVVISFLALQPTKILEYCHPEHGHRSRVIVGIERIKNIDQHYLDGRVLINVGYYDYVNAMFYRDVPVIVGIPPQRQLDSLIEEGYLFSALQQWDSLPAYVEENPAIWVIPWQPQ